MTPINIKKKSTEKRIEEIDNKIDLIETTLRSHIKEDKIFKSDFLNLKESVRDFKDKTNEAIKVSERLGSVESTVKDLSKIVTDNDKTQAVLINKVNTIFNNQNKTEKTLKEINDGIKKNLIEKIKSQNIDKKWRITSFIAIIPIILILWGGAHRYYKKSLIIVNDNIINNGKIVEKNLSDKISKLDTLTKISIKNLDDKIKEIKKK